MHGNMIDNTDLDERARFCESALGIDSMREAGADAMYSAWRTYDQTHQLDDETRAVAIRDAVEHSRQCLNALTPRAGEPRLDEGGQIEVSWIDTTTGVDLVTAFDVIHKASTSVLVEGTECATRQELDALILDLQRAAMAWEWLEAQRRDTEAAERELDTSDS